MMNLKKSISFIGMAGCGKTSIGRLLAKKHGISFIDTDHLIEKRLNKSLQDIKDEKGYMYLREIEQEIVLAIDTSIQIISTGGSVIYSEKAITHLKQISSVVFIDTPYELIKERIGDASDRGFSVPDGFVTDTDSSQVFAVEIKFVSFISVILAPKPYFVSVK